VIVLTAKQDAGAAAHLYALGRRNLRFLALCAWLVVAFIARSLFRIIWRLLRDFTVWLVTKSPLSEPRRSAHRPLLQLIPWIIIAAGWVAVTIVSLAAYYAAVLPDPQQAMVFRLPPNLTILARGGEFIAERGMRRAYVAYKDIPQSLVKAVLATEDRRFFYHFGLDPIGLVRAASANWRSGEVLQGGSTITQQLAKNLFLQPKRTWSRKAEEFILALWLESRFKKQEILELYLNRVYFGSGNFGIGAASHYYFGKAPRDITLSEAALLAGNIRARLQGRPPKAFHFQSLGSLCVVGYHTACAEIKGLRFSGLFAWLLWRAIYLSKLPGFERKARVLVDWLLEMFFPRDTVQTLDLDNH